MQTCCTSLLLLTTLSLSQGGVVFPSDRSNDSRSLISLFENSRDNILSSLSRPHSFSDREKRIKDKLQKTISQLVELMFKQEQMKVFNQDEISFGEDETESNFASEESIENMSTENIIFQETTWEPETNEETTTESNLDVDNGRSKFAKLQLRPRRLDDISDRTLSKIGIYSDAVNFENSGNISLNEVDGPIQEFECDEITNVCGKHPKYPGDKFARALARGNKLTLKMVEALATNPAPAIEELPRPEMRARHNMPQEIGLRSSSFELFSARSAPSPMKPKMEAEAENICKTISKQITPRSAKNIDGQVKWILNQPKGGEQYVQLVDTTICQGEGNECLSGLVSGHKTQCKQQYSVHKLLALSDNGDELVIDTFRFPSCCTCQVFRGIEL